MPDAPPILVPCEGSGLPTHRAATTHRVGLCQMCGQPVVTDEGGRARPHRRNDIVAMIARGDFDQATEEATRG